MLFKTTNGTFDTTRIHPHEERRFQQYMDYMFHQIEIIINPHRCINLPFEKINQRIKLLQPRIANELDITAEKIEFILSFHTR